MKHLKSYNESSYNISRQDILEICYDLTDDKGFSVTIEDCVISPPPDNINIKATVISIEKIGSIEHITEYPHGSNAGPSIPFIIDDEILNVLIRIADYAGDELFDISALLSGDEYKWKMYYKNLENIETWRLANRKDYDTYSISDLPDILGTSTEFMNIYIKKRLI